MKKYYLTSIPLRIIFIVLAILYTLATCIVIQSYKETHILLIVLCVLVWSFFIFSTYIMIINRIVIKDDYLICYGVKRKEFYIPDIKDIQVKVNEICIKYKGKIYKYYGYSHLKIYRGFSKKEEDKTIKIVNDIINSTVLKYKIGK